MTFKPLLTQLVLKDQGGPALLPDTNPIREVAVEVAVIGPVMLPLIGATTLHEVTWFYPHL